jgi:hypothetical protein
MNKNTHTVFAAFLSPMLLLLLIQGGSCQSSGRRETVTNRNANANTPTKTNANAPGVDAAKVNANLKEVEKEKPPVNEDASSEGARTGMWSGDHISLEVTTGGAKVEFDCAHGSIKERLVLGAGGRFNVAGDFVQERGGPVREGEESDSRRARYAGTVEGKTMTLTVTLTENNEKLGTFTLTHGREPMLTKCR